MDYNIPSNMTYITQNGIKGGKMIKGKNGQYLPENADLEHFIEPTAKTVVNKKKTKALEDLSSLQLINNLDSQGTSELMY